MNNVTNGFVIVKNGSRVYNVVLKNLDTYYDAYVNYCYDFTDPYNDFIHTQTLNVNGVSQR